MEVLDKLKVISVIVTVPIPPVVKGTIKADEVLRLLLSIWPDSQDKICLSDNEYDICPIADLRRFVDWDNTNLFPYTSEGHDCDDFAMAMAGDIAKYPGWSGFPFSFIWGNLYGGHAFCIAIAWLSLEDRTPTIYFVEPQTDQEIVQEIVEEMSLWLLAI